MSVITSKDSRTFKELLKLTRKKYRDREGLFIAEGPNICGEALGGEYADAVRIYAREGSGCEKFTEDTVVLSGELFDRVSDTMTSQGVLAVVRKPDHGAPEDAIKTSGDIIVLDRLQDPGNIGTIIRTAEGAGIRAAAFIKGTCDPFSPKVVRACAGSILRMPIVFFESADEFIRAARDSGYRLAVTDVERGVPYYEAGLRQQEERSSLPAGASEKEPPEDAGMIREPSSRKKIALVIGNEGNGVSDTFRDAADILVNIPMRGRLESLNASVAAALLMYEMGRPE